jgi:hypothetical protein
VTPCSGTLIEKNRDTATWSKFDKLIHQRFGAPLHGNALGELIQLQRETTVADYQSKFLALVMRCTDLVQKHQIDIFTNGLCNLLKTDVELEAPATLEDALALARTYEQRYTHSRACLAALAQRPNPWRCPRRPPPLHRQPHG